jgi:hypothetical protein
LTIPINLYIQITGFESTDLIIIRDLNGKTHLTKQINSNDKININSLSKGVYLIEINTNEGSILKKIIKN